jgi:SLOG cluster4 family
MRRGEELGREIARRGWILLTGGQVLERSVVEPIGAVKDAAMLGADGAERESMRGADTAESERVLGADAAEGEGHGSVAARLVGILPSRTVQWRRPLARRLFLDTGLPHNVRNAINGLTPDIVIAFGGSQGTLAEIAFAKAASREVIFYAGLGYGGISSNTSERNQRISIERPTSKNHCGPIRRRAELPGAYPG